MMSPSNLRDARGPRPVLIPSPSIFDAPSSGPRRTDANAGHRLDLVTRLVPDTHSPIFEPKSHHGLGGFSPSPEPRQPTPRPFPSHPMRRTQGVSTPDTRDQQRPCPILDRPVLCWPACSAPHASPRAVAKITVTDSIGPASTVSVTDSVPSPANLWNKYLFPDHGHAAVSTPSGPIDRGQAPTPWHP
jgi:hypothetical protein